MVRPQQKQMDNENKICTKCNEDWPMSHYYLSRGRRTHVCKNCNIKRIQIRYEQNQDKLQEYGRTYYLDNLEKRKKQVNDYRLKNLETVNAKKKIYNAKNKDKTSKRSAAYQKKRKTYDPAFKLLCSLRGRTNKAVKHGFKSAKTLELLGCSPEYLKEYFGAKFTEGMTWEIFLKSGRIHVDHIRPCSSFDLTDPAQQRICFHYTAEVSDSRREKP